MASAVRQPVAHTIMFWFLTTSALVIFAPCVLVPAWRHVESLQEDELRVAAVVARLQDEINRNNRQIKALESDPQVIERIARRELNQRPEGEQHLQWSPAELAALRLNLPADLGDRQPVAIPRPAKPDWMLALGKWLPGWALSEVFVRPPHRRLLLIMAGCMLVTAFVLYAPRDPSKPADPH